MLTNLALNDFALASWQTVYMVFIASVLSIVIGLFIGLWLHLTQSSNAWSKRLINYMLGFVVNVVRSVPFIILLIILIPLTRWLVGTTIGTQAAMVSLSIAAIAFYARIAQSAVSEVAPGLIEAARSMGASTSQVVFKVLIPESLPALIKGGTLTVIGLIGYSAMAGAVGGGGLGELAINYGYQRFDAWVMLEAVVLLVVIVQLIQWLGDYCALKRRVKPIVILSIVLTLACIVNVEWPTAIANDTLSIGVIGNNERTIYKVVKQEAKKRYGLNIKLVTFDDYVQPNTALSAGSIDANIMQHVPYLKAQIKAHGYQLTPIAKTFVYPMGFYSIKIKNINQLKPGSVIAIPNDPSNEGRALLILQAAGLIKLQADVGTTATVQDIVSNPYQLQFKLLDAAQLPRVLPDASLVAITNDYLSGVHLHIQQALLRETADSPYANVIVVQTKDSNEAKFKQLIEVMHSKPVLKATLKLYPNGAAIPAW